MNEPANLIDLAPDLADLRESVLEGLRSEPRSLPPWLFYDSRGSQLFEEICRQPEYYPTRTELSILREHGDEIAALLGEGCTIIELGSGAHYKAQELLQALNSPDGYVAIDVSRAALSLATHALQRAFPELPVTGIIADYGPQAELPLTPNETAGSRMIGFFPGSTIGNMHPSQAQEFLAGWAPRLAGGGMLVGVDLVKDKAVLDAAYNDAASVTAAFNRNMLVRIARELDTDLDPSQFEHRAFFDPEQSRVEMHLVAERSYDFCLEGEDFSFGAGEGIHTENSYKYTLDGFQGMAERAGFAPEQVWTDPAELFSVHYLSSRAD